MLTDEDTDETVPLKFKRETITNSCNQKLLAIVLNNKFDFDEHVIMFIMQESLPEFKYSCKSFTLYELSTT